MQATLKATAAGAYTGSSQREIAGTANLLRYFRAFIRSGANQANDPTRSFGWTMTRDEAITRLRFLIDTAINRKAGLPDRDYPMHRGQADEVSRALRTLYRNDPELHVRINHYTPAMMRALRHELRRCRPFPAVEGFIGAASLVFLHRRAA